MKKTYKILTIIFLTIISIISIIVYQFYKSNQKTKLAQKQANHIIENLDNSKIVSEFPTKNFQDRMQLEDIIRGIQLNCDWQNRDGKYVDFFTEKQIGGKKSIAFIYEYYLKCDSLRFILFYDLDQDKPELFKFYFEPVENENKMIIFPEKQLVNRK
jgi:hypothetical protein